MTACRAPDLEKSDDVTHGTFRAYLYSPDEEAGGLARNRSERRVQRAAGHRRHTHRDAAAAAAAAGGGARVMTWPRPSATCQSTINSPAHTCAAVLHVARALDSRLNRRASSALGPCTT